MKTPEPATKNIDYYRNKLRAALAFLDRCEPIMRRLPDYLQSCAGFTDEWIQFSSCSREEVLGILSALNGHHWTKRLSNDPTLIDYETTIDGIRVLIYAAHPPNSCQIVEEEIEVPAHKEVKRTLICK